MLAQTLFALFRASFSAPKLINSLGEVCALAADACTIHFRLYPQLFRALARNRRCIKKKEGGGGEKERYERRPDKVDQWPNIPGAVLVVHKRVARATVISRMCTNVSSPKENH